jgi:hypothetical protein
VQKAASRAIHKKILEKGSAFFSFKWLATKQAADVDLVILMIMTINSDDLIGRSAVRAFERRRFAHLGSRFAHSEGK